MMKNLSKIVQVSRSDSDQLFGKNIQVKKNDLVLEDQAPHHQTHEPQDKAFAWARKIRWTPHRLVWQS